MWFLPQSLGTAVSLFAGVHNVGVVPSHYELKIEEKKKRPGDRSHRDAFILPCGGLA